MDTSQKKILKVLGVLLIGALLWYLLFFDSRVHALNGLLENDDELASYPYHFQVFKLEENIAIVSSPRSPRHSALVSLRIMFPNLVYENDDSPRMLEAQKQLAKIQYRAKEIIEKQPDVKAVKWELDERWLNNNGVTVY